jgi:methionyl-tRNA formyltransferase
MPFIVASRAFSEIRPPHATLITCPLASGDVDNVGMTTLRIDRGGDAGPVYGYSRVRAHAGDSHVVVQPRVVIDNLDAIREKLRDIERGAAPPLDTAGLRPRGDDRGCRRG